jgi:hypothetical protein
MSKTLHENFLTVSERIIKVLTDNGLVKRNGTVNFSAAERKCGMKSTILQKAAKRDGGLYDDNLDKFLRTFKVRREWFLKGTGDIYDENLTDEQKPTDNKEMEEIKINLSEYSVIPKVVLEGSQLVSKSEIDRAESKVQLIIQSKDELIKELRDQLKVLRSAPVPAK